DTVSSLLCKAGGVRAHAHLYRADHFAHVCLLPALRHALLLKHSLELGNGSCLLGGLCLLLLHRVVAAAVSRRLGCLLLPVATGDSADLRPVRGGGCDVRLDGPAHLAGGAICCGLGHASWGETLEQPEQKGGRREGLALLPPPAGANLNQELPQIYAVVEEEVPVEGRAVFCDEDCQGQASPGCTVSK